MGLFSRKPKEHNVEVHDVTPEGPADYEPYFVAICSCGWLGDTVDSSEESFREAYKHSPTVATDLKRPVA